MKQENIVKLQEDLDKLIEKHQKMIDNNDFGGALNIMKNIDILTTQLKRMDYETLTSKYKTKDVNTGDEYEELAVWKQNSFGQIKDHKTYRIVPTELKIGSSNIGFTQVKINFSDETIDDIIKRIYERFRNI